jgi:lysophospholipase L1-like esterase
MNTSKYFFQTLLVIIVSALSFLTFKTFLPKKLFSETTIASKNIVVDSLLLEAIAEDNDTIAADTLSELTIDYKITNGVKFPDETFENYKGNQYLLSFFEKLFQLETKNEGNVRIAYFGDSMTDGDLIVKDFRTYLQEKFGGQGVGFVNITSESASSRSSLVHEFSANWKTQSYLKVKRPLHPFGVNGHVFYSNDTSNVAWVKYKANKTRFASDLPKPTLFYGSSKNKEGKIKYILGTDTISKKLTPNSIVNTLVLSETNLKTLKVNFKKADSIPIYGFNFDDGKGVHVDNFSNRGNSGLPIGSFDIATMRAFHAKLDYDLIVLQYGANVLNYGSLNYGWYEKRMTKVVAHLKECFPGVAILIVSTADKSTKYDLEMKTDSAVVPLNTAQKRYAIKSESSFVNMYTLMGGDGSMIQWVEQEPSRANKDYTHFNHRGAKEAANLVFAQLNQGYEMYKELRKKRKKPVARIKKDSVIINKDSVHEE